MYPTPRCNICGSEVHLTADHPLTRLPGDDPTEDPRFIGAVDLLGRTGATKFGFQFCNEFEGGVVWMARVEYEDNSEVCASYDPLQAVFRLCDQLIDGGECKHCHRPTGFAPELGNYPVPAMVCWYQWDPELRTFRRSCE